MSMGLIDKETMIREAQKIIGNEAGYKAWAILNAIREAPEAVVRCKDCKNAEIIKWLDNAIVCKKHNYTGVRPDEFYCADGKRRGVDD